jgi:hypothetical protein
MGQAARPDMSNEPLDQADELRELMLVLRQALLMIVRHIEKRYPSTK